MEIPYDNITSAELSEDATQGQSRATIVLKGYPTFFREFTTPGGNFGNLQLGMGQRTWQQCDDWTENRQASSALLHVIVGRTSALEHALAPFLPQDDAMGEDADGEVDDAEFATSSMRRKISGASSRRSSGASGSPIAAIQTPSLLSVLPSPAPPSAYRDPFSAPRSAQPRSAPQSAAAHARKRSRSDASSPFEYYSEFDYDFDQSGRRSAGGSISPTRQSQQHQQQQQSQLHHLVTQSAMNSGRPITGPFSAGPFASTDSGFALQQDQHSSRFDTGPYTDFDQLLSYSGGQGTGAGTSGAPGSASAHDDSFLADAPVPIARSYSSSNASSTGRGPVFMGTGSRPGTAASMHSLSHSSFDAQASHSQPAGVGMHAQGLHMHPSQQQNQHAGFNLGMDAMHGSQHGMEAPIDFGMSDINLMFPSHSHGDFNVDDQQQQPLSDGTQSFVQQNQQDDLSGSAPPAEVPLPISPHDLGADQSRPASG